MKKIYLICLFIIGCASKEEIDNQTRKEYSALSCDQLKDKRDFFDKELKKIKEDRELIDGLNVVANIFSMISIISGNSGTINGNSGDSATNLYEMESRRKLEILREIMVEKKCNDCQNQTKPENSMGISPKNKNTQNDTSTKNVTADNVAVAGGSVRKEPKALANK